MKVKFWRRKAHARSAVYVTNVTLIGAMRFTSGQQESLALASMARDNPPASSTAAAMRGKVGSEFET